MHVRCSRKKSDVAVMEVMLAYHNIAVLNILWKACKKQEVQLIFCC